MPWICLHDLEIANEDWYTGWMISWIIWLKLDEIASKYDELMLNLKIYGYMLWSEWFRLRNDFLYIKTCLWWLCIVWYD